MTVGDRSRNDLWLALSLFFSDILYPILVGLRSLLENTETEVSESFHRYEMQGRMFEVFFLGLPQSMIDADRAQKKKI